MGVKGSVESYTFVKNNPINKWDYLGLKWNITRDAEKIDKIPNTFFIQFGPATTWEKYSHLDVVSHLI